jgi:ACT domain-containing protein
MKKLITEKELAAHGSETFTVEDHLILAPSARDYASREGIRLIYPQRDGTTSTQDSPMDQAIREIVTAELGRADRNVIQAVRAGVGRAVGDNTDSTAETTPQNNPESPAVHAARHSGEINRAVLSITGINRIGILGAFTGIISNFGCDIVNVSQTVVSGFFTMVLIVDLVPLSEQNVSFETFRENVLSEAKKFGVEAMLMHEDVLKAMHRV